MALTGPTNSPDDLKPRGVKAPIGLLPYRGLQGIAAALEYGANKYRAWNWQEHYPDETDEMIRQVYGGAALRHLMQWTDPSEDDYDDESGLHHLFHAGACVVIAIWRLGLKYTAPKKPGEVTWISSKP